MQSMYLLSNFNILYKYLTLIVGSVENQRTYIYSYSFSRRFYPKLLTNEENGNNQNKQKSNDLQVL